MITEVYHIDYHVPGIGFVPFVVSLDVEGLIYSITWPNSDDYEAIRAWVYGADGWLKIQNFINHESTKHRPDLSEPPRAD